MSHKNVVIEPQPNIILMKEKLLIKRNELLQKVADFIIRRLENARNDSEFDYWIWLGLSINFWCVERDIYLN